MNRNSRFYFLIVFSFVLFVIYVDRNTFLGGLGDMLAVFIVIYAWLNLDRNEDLKAIKELLAHRELVKKNRRSNK